MMNQNGGLHKEVSAIFGGSTSTSGTGVLLEERPEPLSPPVQPEIESKMLPASLNNFKSSISLFDRALIWVEQQKAKGDIRQVVMIALIPILFTVLAYFLWGSIFPSTPNTNSQPRSAIKAIANAATFIDSSQASTGYFQASVYPESLRDPMAIASVSKASSALQTGSVNIKGILFNATNPEKSSAIIGNKVLKVGGKIADIEIVEITRDYVEFKNNDKVWRETVGQ